MSDWATGNGHRDDLPPRGTGRRRSLFILVLLLLGLPLAFVIRSVTDEGWRQVTSVDVLRERDVIYLPQIEVFLVHGDPPVALSATSPHLQELLVYCVSSQTFVSLEHGELFDRTGRYMSGPAPRGMSRVPLRERQGAIEVNIQRRMQGPPRGEFSPPAGPLCYPPKLVGPGFIERAEPA